MQRTAALRRIEGMRFKVGPKINQLTALGNSMHGFSAVHSRGVEAAPGGLNSRRSQRKQTKNESGNHQVNCKAEICESAISVKTDSERLVEI